jgi:hypothetical protein
MELEDREGKNAIKRRQRTKGEEIVRIGRVKERECEKGVEETQEG